MTATGTGDEAPSLGDRLAGMVPGPELAKCLATIDPADLDDDYDVLEVLAAWDRLKSWVDAQPLAAVVKDPQHRRR